jgi:hypothetical protein
MTTRIRRASRGSGERWRDESRLNPVDEFRKLPMNGFSLLAVRSAWVRVRATNSGFEVSSEFEPG